MHTPQSVVYLRAVLCLIIAAGFLIGFVGGIARLPMPRAVKVSGCVVFACAAVKNLAIVGGVAAQPWTVIVDLVEAVAIVVFFTTLLRLTADVRARMKEEAAPAEVEL